MFLKLGYLETLSDWKPLLKLLKFRSFSDLEGYHFLKTQWSWWSIVQIITRNKTYCLCKIWSAIIIIVPEASIFPITMANMSWVITLSRDGDDGDGEQAEYFNAQSRAAPPIQVVSRWQIFKCVYRVYNIASLLQSGWETLLRRCKSDKLGGATTAWQNYIWPVNVFDFVHTAHWAH